MFENKENIYYVYIFLDPRKSGKFVYSNIDFSFLFEPFYVGKGQRTRWCSHFSEIKTKKISHKINKIKKIIKETGRPFTIKTFVD